MTISETNEHQTRRVRPWIAALLTFIGWGVGFYYARKSKAAWFWAWASVIIGVALGLAFAAYLLLAPTDPLDLLPSDDAINSLSLINLGITLIVACLAWSATAREKHVAKGGPTRMLGYIVVWLLPLLLSLILASAIRFTLVQPYRIPAGSMQPTLQIGDYVVASKWSYGYSRFSFAPFESLLPHGRWLAQLPSRGDLVVFRPNPEPDRDFVKRIVGLPGDRIQMIDGALYINREPVRREDLGLTTVPLADGGSERVQAWRESLPGGASYTVLDRFSDGELDNTRVFIVPDGNYFMMGDDRDNSADSRTAIVGFVPIENLVGRIDRVFSRSDSTATPER